MNTWSLRPAAPGDAAPLAALACDTFSETFTHYTEADRTAHLNEFYTPDVFADYIRDPANELWVAECKGDLVAYAKIGEYKLPLEPVLLPVIELHRIYVRKAWHGQKIGAALMEKLYAAAHRNHAKSIYIGVWENNVSAQRFYAHHGFTKVGEYMYPPIGATHDREWILMKAL